jgi:tagaturonate reductase
MKRLNKEYVKTPDMPERVLQFGTGVLLRGLPDFLIDKANKKGVFNGSIVIVKSTGAVEKVFEMQDCCYTLRQRGLENGAAKDETSIITSVSRVLSAVEHWSEILYVAANPYLEIILSNTTEAGLVYQAEDIFASPPKSFPAKLTAFLYERFRLFDGAPMRGVTIVPTELIVNNGVLLKKYVLQHAENNRLGQPFSTWLDEACDFCDSLVDKIVTGAPSSAEKEKCWANWGYQDDLCIDAEHFTLWAIECNERAEKRLRAAVASDENVILSADITPFREQKLRLLNGGHTISVALSYLTGLQTVGEMMNDAITGLFVRQVILKEILPTVLPICDTAEGFANAVLNRFCNPFIIHPLLNITFQNTAKMQMRNALTFKRYYEKTGDLPSLMCLGFAGYLLFAKAEKVENGQFFGKNNGLFYKINDDKAAFLNEHWQKVTQHDSTNLSHFVENVLNDERIFEKNAFDLPNFASKIATYLHQLLQQGAIQTLKNYLND